MEIDFTFVRLCKLTIFKYLSAIILDIHRRRLSYHLSVPFWVQALHEMEQVVNASYAFGHAAHCLCIISGEMLKFLTCNCGIS